MGLVNTAITYPFDQFYLVVSSWWLRERVVSAFFHQNTPSDLNLTEQSYYPSQIALILEAHWR